MPKGYPRNPKPLSTGRVARHARVVRARGKAKEYTCPCGQQAHDWSYNHGEDPDDVMSYEPLCRKCHIAKDIDSYIGRQRPDVAARNAGNSYARKCPEGCTCGKHFETWRKRKSA